MDTPDAFKLLQEILKAEDNNEDVTESKCEEYNKAITSVPPTLHLKTIIASLTSHANTILLNEESVHADSSMSDDDGNDPDSAPSTNTSHLTENDSFTATENGSPKLTTSQNAPVTRSSVSRTSRIQHTNTNSPAPQPGTSHETDNNGPVASINSTNKASTNPKKKAEKPGKVGKKCKEEENGQRRSIHNKDRQSYAKQTKTVNAN